MLSRESSRKLVALHIGAHKTGTSVLQNYLRSHERQLRGARVLYLRRSELARITGFGKALRDNPGALADVLDRFDHRRRYRILVGSNENLVGRPFPKRGDGSLYPNAPRNIEALAEVLRGRAAKVVLGIRPQPEFLESYYLQTVHQGGYETFDRWLQRVDLDRLSWRPIVDALHAAFGPERVEILDFRSIEHGEAAFVREFLTRIDPRLTLDTRDVSAANRSVSAKGLQMALAINPYLETGGERRAVRLFLQEHFSNARYPRPTLFSDADKTALHDRYDAEYEELVSAPRTATG